MTTKAPQEILEFWFGRLTRQQWFQRSDALDEEISRRFSDVHLSLARGEVENWRETPESRLAAIIVLDQFSRHIYRGTALAFATDWMALREAKLALSAGADADTPPERRGFIYLPFEHSEDIADQERSVALFEALGDAEYLDYAQRHLAVIRQFGRFPHRNVFLGRETTDAELDYLSKPGAGF